MTDTPVDPSKLTGKAWGEYMHQVRLKYDPLFWRQPNVFAVGEGIFQDEEGNLIQKSGIIVTVTKKVDQNTLPHGNRIPDCLEGVPVQIQEGNVPRLLRNLSVEDTAREEPHGIA